MSSTAPPDLNARLSRLGLDRDALARAHDSATIHQHIRLVSAPSGGAVMKALEIENSGVVAVPDGRSLLWAGVRRFVGSAGVGFTHEIVSIGRAPRELGYYVATLGTVDADERATLHDHATQPTNERRLASFANYSPVGPRTSLHDPARPITLGDVLRHRHARIVAPDPETGAPGSGYMQPRVREGDASRPITMAEWLASGVFTSVVHFPANEQEPIVLIDRDGALCSLFDEDERVGLAHVGHIAKPRSVASVVAAAEERGMSPRDFAMWERGEANRLRRPRGDRQGGAVESHDAYVERFERGEKLEASLRAASWR